MSVSRPKNATAAPTELRALFAAHYPAIWRLLRRLGVREPQVDDAAQEVFWVAARRLDDIEPGSERSFLYGVALRIAANMARRQAAMPPLIAIESVSFVPDLQPSAEEMLAEKEARALLEEALDHLPQDLRVVLVLHEIEGIELRKIAEMEAIPPGTASSRLRRARQEFSAIATRIRARLRRRGGQD